MSERVDRYFHTLAQLLRESKVTDSAGQSMPLAQGFDKVRDAAHIAHDAGNKLIYIGNGGSAAIASHLAIDYSKNGGIRSLAFNDSSALTCLGNDLGYENVFAKQID
ncbi:MAG: phosphoheptose isomerase, partial [Pseudolabrys sp.]